MLGKPSELRISTASREDLGVACGGHAPTLALQRPGDDRRPAAPGTAPDKLVDELDEIIWKPNRDLFTHPDMVPLRYHRRSCSSALFRAENAEAGTATRRVTEQRRRHRLPLLLIAQGSGAGSSGRREAYARALAPNSPQTRLLATAREGHPHGHER